MQKGLAVGINEFKFLSGSNLRGCVYDAEMQSWMWQKYYGFPKSSILMLLNEQATREAVLDAYQWINADYSTLDEFAIIESSHGTTVPDLSGDEPTGLDSALCCHDCYFDDKGRIINTILDDEVHENFKNVPANIPGVITIDACHSGDMTREFNPIRSLPLIPAAADLLTRAIARGLVTAGIGSDTLPIQYLPGCGLRQTSADAYIDGHYCGAFSHCLRQVLIANPYLPLPEVAKQVNALLVRNGYSQRTAPEGMYKYKSYLWRKAG